MNKPTRTRAPRWLWPVLALVAGALVFVVTNVTQSSCYDSIDPAASICETELAVGTGTAWLLWIAFGAFAIYCTVRTVRR